jgi:hypothetical protein
MVQKGFVFLILLNLPVQIITIEADCFFTAPPLRFLYIKARSIS